jgi:hypothetical protein
VVRNTILGGSSVQDGNIHISPRVKGSWIGINPVYDPKEHKITVDAFPTAELRKALEEDVGIEILGRKVDGGALIGLVTDVLTGKTDGTVSTGGDIIIRGGKIKIIPDGDASVGVFFVDANGTDIPLDYPVTENTPKKIVCRVPAQVNGGVYTLKIVTRYASNKTLLKEPRTVVYGLPLKVE